MATVGLDPIDSTARMTFDNINLFDGLSLIGLAIGSLALASIIEQIFDLWRSGGEAETESDAAIDAFEEEWGERITGL